MGRFFRRFCLVLGAAVCLLAALRPAHAQAFDVDIRPLSAPPNTDLMEWLRTLLDLSDYRTFDDLTSDELERLVSVAPADVKNLLATRGHFSPVVTAELDLKAVPRPLVTLRLDPGALSTVASAQLLWDEPAPLPDVQAHARSLWNAQVGTPFSQDNWDELKTQTLRPLLAYRYPKARITHSQAQVDPATGQVALTLRLAAGPPQQFGSLAVQGNQRYSPTMTKLLVELAGVGQGRTYDETVLQDAQQRLMRSGYYDSAAVIINPDSSPDQPEVQVQVHELPLQKWVTGLGATTQSGARLSVEHTHLQVPVLGWKALSQAQWQADTQDLKTHLTQPVDEKGWQWFTGGAWQRQLDGDRVTNTHQFTLGQQQDGTHIDRAFTGTLDRSQDSSRLTGVNDDPKWALSGAFKWTQRQYSPHTLPQRGYGLMTETGAGVTLDTRHTPFLRGLFRWQHWLPLAEDSERPSRLASRLSGGAVWAQPEADIPSGQLFWAGGDQSVRGYNLRSIGVANGGELQPGRYMVSGSLEWQRPLYANGKRSPWEATLFIDTGAVANTPTTLSFYTGVGAGARYLSPVGPLQMDVAYGVHAQQWRLHLSVGVSF